MIGGHHKFRDYYLGMGVECYDFIDFNPEMTEEEIIISSKCRISEDKLFSKQQQIMEVYRSTLEKILETS